MLQEKFLQKFKHEVIFLYFEQLLVLKIIEVPENKKQKIYINSSYLFYKFSNIQVQFFKNFIFLKILSSFFYLVSARISYVDNWEKLKVSIN